MSILVPHRHVHFRGTQLGLTLVELMIGITVGLFITLGLLILVSNTSRSYKIQDDFARIQENGVAALHYLGDDIRMSGFYGLSTSSGVITLDASATTGTDCGSGGNPPTANWALDVATPVIGFSGVTPGTVNGIFPCIAAANFQAGSQQVVVIRSASGYRIPDPNGDGNLSDAVLDNSSLYLQSAPTGGVVFKGSAFAGLKASGLSKGLSTGADAPIYEYQTHVYYIRPCSRPTGAGSTCRASDDGGRPIPTLVRQELVGNSMTEVPLVEGVEAMSLVYMLDLNPIDGVPDRVTFSPTLAEWASVIAVRVSVLIRATTPTAGYSDQGKTYDFGDGTTPVITPPAGDAFKRHIFSQTYQVRNNAQRRGA